MTLGGMMTSLQYLYSCRFRNLHIFHWGFCFVFMQCPCFMLGQEQIYNGPFENFTGGKELPSKYIYCCEYLGMHCKAGSGTW